MRKANMSQIPGPKTRHDGADQTFAAQVAPGWTRNLSYAVLPDRFYELIEPVEFKKPELLKFNEALASDIGLAIGDWSAGFAEHMFTSGKGVADGKVLAMAYSGHQFGSFNPSLGDGRAALIGEIVDERGKRFDVHLKGSGRTPFSRGGDGKAALGPVIREYIISEAMFSLGVPTTRSLAIASTGEYVYRDKVLPGAVLTRIAASHLRIGTFQYFAARGDVEGVKILADFAIARHYPEIAAAGNPYLALFEKVLEAQAALIAKWMSLGFIHGVMNTDNMTISGETIDYGPCAFMDFYDHYKVYSSIDQQGRYAYGSQPNIAQWNLTRLIETLLPFLDENNDAAIEIAKTALEAYPYRFMAHWSKQMSAKFGLAESLNLPEPDSDRQLILRFLSLLQKHGVDFTQSFRLLSRSVEAGEKSDMLLSMLKDDPDAVQWISDWRACLAKVPRSPKDIEVGMLGVNPVYIARNHLVEEAISVAEQNGDFSYMNKLLEAVSSPFEEIAGMDRYAAPPREGEEVTQTFCGT